MTFTNENGETMKKTQNMQKTELERKLAELKAKLNSVEGSPTEVYSRIVGYYRSVKNWNAGKRHEYSKRKMYTISAGETVKAIWSGNTSVSAHPMQENTTDVSHELVNEMRGLITQNNLKEHAGTQFITKYILFVKPQCPNCPPVKNYLKDSSLEASIIDVSTDEGLELARRHNVLATPTVVFYNSCGIEAGRAFSKHEVEQYLIHLA